MAQMAPGGFAKQVFITGGPELERAFKELKVAAATRVLRLAVTKATRVLLKAAKQAAPKDTGYLKKMLGMRIVRYPSSGTTVGVIGAHKGAKDITVKRKPQALRRGEKRMFDPFAPTKKGRPAKFIKFLRTYNARKYLHLVEFGRATVFPQKKRALAAPDGLIGSRARALPGRHFMAGAFFSTRAQVEKLVFDSIREGIDREAAKIAAKVKKPRLAA